MKFYFILKVCLWVAVAQKVEQVRGSILPVLMVFYRVSSNASTDIKSFMHRKKCVDEASSKKCFECSDTVEMH